MTTTKATDRSAAISRLSATRQDDGSWTYYADETSATYRVTDEDIDLLAEMMADPKCQDAYSEWCAATAAEEVEADES